MIKGILFDIGGVLHSPIYDSVYFDKAVEQFMLDTSIAPFWDQQMNLLKIGQINEIQFWKNIESKSGKSINTSKESVFTSEYRKRLVLNDPLLSQISKYKELGIKIGLLSNTYPPHVAHLQSIGFTKLFDVSTFSFESGCCKPDIKIYQLSIQKLNVAANQIAYVDDLEENLGPASSLGMKTVQFVDNEDYNPKIKLLLNQ